MDALLDMCGTKSPSCNTSVQLPQTSTKSTLNRTTTSSSIQLPTALSKNAVNNRSPGLDPERNYASLGATPRTQLTNSCSVKKPMQNAGPVAMDKMAKVRWYIENGKRIMILMRGCPGSGKSYLAEGLIMSYRGKPKDYVFSTDDYFMKKNGYYFQPSQLTEAHQWNQTRVLKKVREGVSPVIVDNTNTQLWEMTVYASLAINHGYLIEILEPDTPWFFKLNELAKRNKHGVPRDKLEIMLDRYERGISVDDLIKSTGANYSKLPPQPAEHSLLSPMTVMSQNMGPFRTVNSDQRTSKREPGSFEVKNFQQNFSPTCFSQSFSGLKETSQVNSKSLSSSECFYFGQNASTGSLNFYTSGKEENCDSPQISVNSLQNSNTRGSDIFSKDFKIGLESITGDKEWDISERIAANSSEMFPIRDKISEVLLPLAPKPYEEGESSRGILASADKNNSALESTSERSHKNNVPFQHYLEVDDITGSFSMANNSSCVQDCTNDDKIVKDKTGDNFNKELKVDPCSADSASSFLSFAPLDVLLKETEASCSVDLLGSSDSDVPEKRSGDNSIQRKSLLSSSWIGMADRNVGCDKNQTCGAIQQNPLPKPPRSFNMKNVQDYCQSVKDLNDTSPNESTGWTFCEDNLISWQPIEKIQGSSNEKDLTSPLKLSDNSQRVKFSKSDVQDKETNTNHGDFCTLNQVSTNGLVDGVVVLNTHYRDINKGRTASGFKIPVKLTLDKGTLTDNDFEVELKTESKQEKIKELSRLFSNKSTAVLKEFLEQCNWDVNYVSNLLLDETDNDALTTSFTGDGIVDSDSDVESSTEEPSAESRVVTESIVENVDNEPFDITDQITPKAVEEAEEVKRHIELSIDFSERSYSPHLLAIKNFRRGLREGAIPKSSSNVSEDPLVVSQGLAEESNEPTPEPSLTPSESSDGDEINETLEFIVGQDFVQQLADKFGGSCNVGSKCLTQQTVIFNELLFVTYILID